MSFFAPSGVIYILVPTLSVTNEMVNSMKKDFNTSSDDIRESNEALISNRKKLFKVRKPVISAFNGYTWYNHSEILVILEGDEWQ